MRWLIAKGQRWELHTGQVVLPLVSEQSDLSQEDWVPDSTTLSAVVPPLLQPCCGYVGCMMCLDSAPAVCTRREDLWVVWVEYLVPVRY